MLNNRKRFVFLAAMAAVLVVLAGGANALALFPALTVRCVPSHTINTSCYNPAPSPEYTTIQAAVNAAVPYDVILVAPGTYPESVTIPQALIGLSLLGAQAGNDARVERCNPKKESIIDATGNPAGSAIIVEAINVVIDGFTVQGGGPLVNATGVDLKGTCPSGPFTPATGAVVVNNIIQNNGTGVSLNSEGCGMPGMSGTPLQGVLIEHNLIRNNNVPQGDGIFTSAVKLAIITDNAFSGNKCAAIGINNSDHVTITNNTSENDGSFVIFTSSYDSQFSHNRGERFGAKGVLPGYGDAAVAVGPGNSALLISDNDLEKGKAPISNGIAFTTIFGPGAANTNIYVKNNRIKCFPGTGILAETDLDPPLPPGMLAYSLILGNEVEDNGLDGIYIDGVATNTNNQLFDNEAEGNHRFDCHDDTSGNRTLNTANTWFANSGKSMNLPELCTPEKRHDHDWR
jgi:hypothetical protein